MRTIDLTSRIERLEDHEERHGVSIEGLSAFLKFSEDEPDESYLEVCGELHARKGKELSRNLSVIVVAYDSAGRVVGLSHDYQARFGRKKFYEFEPFSIFLSVPTHKVAKVRVYPKPS